MEYVQRNHNSPNESDYPRERTVDYGRDMLAWLRSEKNGRSLTESVGVLADQLSKRVEDASIPCEIESPLALEPVISKRGAHITFLSFRRHPLKDLEPEMVYLRGDVVSFYASYDEDVETIFARVDCGTPERRTEVGYVKPLWGIPIEKAIIQVPHTAEKNLSDAISQAMLQVDTNERFKLDLVIDNFQRVVGNSDSSQDHIMATFDATMKIILQMKEQPLELKALLHEYIQRYLHIGEYHEPNAHAIVCARRHRVTLPTQVAKGFAPGGAMDFHGVIPYLGEMGETIDRRPGFYFHYQHYMEEKDFSTIWVALEDIEDFYIVNNAYDSP